MPHAARAGFRPLGRVAIIVVTLFGYWLVPVVFG
jgi:hypothetical protein